jgi:hypothetical protein
MFDLWPQEQAFAATGPVRLWLDGTYSLVPQQVLALLQLLATLRNVLAVEDAGGRDGDRLLEECPIKLPHCAIDRRPQQQHILFAHLLLIVSLQHGLFSNSAQAERCL